MANGNNFGGIALVNAIIIVIDAITSIKTSKIILLWLKLTKYDPKIAKNGRRHRNSVLGEINKSKSIKTGL